MTFLVICSFLQPSVFLSNIEIFSAAVSLNVVFEWMHRIQNIPVSNLRLNFGYFDNFHCFTQSLRENAWTVPQIRPGGLCPTSFLIQFFSTHPAM
jgi:hypothetical protein